MTTPDALNLFWKYSDDLYITLHISKSWCATVRPHMPVPDVSCKILVNILNSKSLVSHVLFTMFTPPSIPQSEETRAELSQIAWVPRQVPGIPLTYSYFI